MAKVPKIAKEETKLRGKKERDRNRESASEREREREKVQPLNEKPSETTVEFLASLAGVLVTGLFIITFILQAFEIPSGSMEDTLLIGDHLFVNREQFAPPARWLGPLLPYRDVRRDEIAVFMSPEQPGLFLVKRIIGIPGDRIHLRDDVVYRNGEALTEPYIRHKRQHSPYTDNFPTVPAEGYLSNAKWEQELPSHIENGEIVVPPDGYFAMGDSRENSYDSRFWGFIPRKNLIGRPMFIYWSFNTPDDQYQMRAWGDRVAFLAHVIIHFFDETRWARTLKVVR
jgi:signal peptidase I